MAWSFSGDKPIFMQLVDKITLDILTGKYSSGDRLPTVREISLDAGVNPNTVQRALSEAETTGLVEIRRGDGSYVTSDQSIINEAREKKVAELTNRFVSSLRSFGLSDSDMETIVKESIKKERKDSDNG
ncbi:MAG: GntR family transcriptional regulator [Clostridiales bacterium]|nr:GntR family transcriptional regulator [Clostridiales bacterium]